MAKTPTEIAADAVTETKSVAAAVEPSLPAQIVMAAEYVWFVDGVMYRRVANDVVTDAAEIKYLLSINAKLKA